MSDLLQTDQQRLERLERYVAKIDQSVKELEQSASQGDLETLNEDEIRYYLSALPQLIADSGLLLAKTQRAVSYATLDAKVINAELWKEANEQKDELNLTNAKDREAYVVSNPKYIKAQQQVFEWKYQCDRAQIVFERYESLFIGVRKLCSLLPQYYKAQDDYVKYAN